MVEAEVRDCHKRDECSQPCGGWRGQISPQFGPLGRVTHGASIFSTGGTNNVDRRLFVSQ